MAIGAGNLKFEAKSKVPPDRVRLFSDALIGVQQRAGVFAATTGKIAFLGERLFRTTISFPANVPTGAYLVEIFLQPASRTQAQWRNRGRVEASQLLVSGLCRGDPARKLEVSP